MSWREFLQHHAETLGISAAFAFMGSAFLLFLQSISADATPISRGKATAVVVAALLVDAVATAFVHGYLGWSPFLTPFIGVMAGLVALPLLMTVIRSSRRIEERADDIADKGVSLLPGKDDKP